MIDEIKGELDVHDLKVGDKIFRSIHNGNILHCEVTEVAPDFSEIKMRWVALTYGNGELVPETDPSWGKVEGHIETYAEIRTNLGVPRVAVSVNQKLMHFRKDSWKAK